MGVVRLEVCAEGVITGIFSSGTLDDALAIFAGESRGTRVSTRAAVVVIGLCIDASARTEGLSAWASADAVGAGGSASADRSTCAAVLVVALGMDAERATGLSGGGTRKLAAALDAKASTWAGRPTSATIRGVVLGVGTGVVAAFLCGIAAGIPTGEGSGSITAGALALKAVFIGRAGRSTSAAIRGVAL